MKTARYLAVLAGISLVWTVRPQLAVAQRSFARSGSIANDRMDSERLTAGAGAMIHHETGRGQGGFGSGQDFGSHRSIGQVRDFGHDGRFDHRFRRGRFGGSSFVFFSGYPGPYYYPSYGYYAPSADYSQPDYYSYTYGNNPVADQSPAGSQDPRGYFQLGHDWAQDLRQDLVQWDQFVAYVRAYIVNAPAIQRDQFRGGFVGAYGINGDAAFDKATQQAGGPTEIRPKIIRPSASGSAPGY